MPSSDRYAAISLMRSQRYEDAFGVFQDLLTDDPSIGVYITWLVNVLDSPTETLKQSTS